MKKLFLVLCLFGAFSFAKSQDAANSNVVPTNIKNSINEEESQWLQNRIGLYGSFFSGYGLSYQHQFENGISIRTQAFAYGSNDDNNDYNSDEIQITFGVDLQYTLKKSKTNRLYILAGSFIDYVERGNNNYFYEFPSRTKDYDIKRYINVGVGIGMEMIAWQNISFVIEGGYYGRFGNNTITVFNNGTNYKEKQTPKSFGFGVGAGISYAF